METLKNDDLLQRIEELENKLQEAEQTIEAIKYDKIDALVISTPSGDQIFTLHGADRPYRIFLEQMNEGAITVSKEGVILYCNKSFADLLNTPMEKVMGSDLISFSEQQDCELLEKMIFSEGSCKEEINLIRSDGLPVLVYLSKTHLNIEGIEPVLCIIATDLTEKKKSEEIVAAEKLARSILEQAGEAIVVCDENMRIIRANQAAEVLAGSPVLFKPFDFIFPLFDKQKTRVPIISLVESKKTELASVALIEGDNKVHLLLNIGQLYGVNGEILGYVINLTNITEHIKAEEKLTSSLKEKTILLKEIHHRVKNNLQIISSLLALQAVNVQDESLLGILSECRNRIGSMALIHQKLYESKSFSSISISEYLKELISSLNSSYKVYNCKVDLDLPPEDINLTIESAIPLGLLMNELVTNSFKHAFHNNHDGELCIKIRAKENSRIEITLSDNGSGFPDNLDFYNPDTLGLQLVHTLVKQLNGDVELVESSGTTIRIEIPSE